MDLYRGTISKSQPGGVLSHFGSMLAGIHRLDSIFARQQLRSYDIAKNQFWILNRQGRPVRREALHETFSAFGSYMEQATLSHYKVEIKNPLRLTDCWTDDPIGSGAMEIFHDNKDLTERQIDELKEVFSPFEKIVYTEDVDLLVSEAERKKIIEKRHKDPIFQQELIKRHERSNALGENWGRVGKYEVIWTDLTLRLRDWSLENGYDSFVYKNDNEDRDSDSYVTLNDTSSIELTGNFKFNKEQFMDTTLPVFRYFMENYARNPNNSRHVQGIFWSGYDPKEFWSKP